MRLWRIIYLPAIRRPAYKEVCMQSMTGFRGGRHGGRMMKVCSELARGSRTARGDGARRA